MPSSAEVLIAAALAIGAAGDQPPFDPPGGAPTSAASDSRPAEPRPAYDSVGRAAVLTNGSRSIGALHRSLPLGSFAEITAIETGRVILVRIEGRADSPDEIALAPGAAAALGVVAGASVRVRAAVASPADAAALGAGQPASPRMDAPPALLAALRRKIAPAPIATAAATAAVRRAPSARVAAVVPPAPTVRPGRSAPGAASASTGIRVQVAAVSNEARARQIARSLNGSVEGAGSLWRVRLGPFRDASAARVARDAAVRRGYADAQILP